MRIPLVGAILLMMVASCGGDSDAEARVLSISEAAEGSPGDLATVEGFIVADSENIRLCEALAESFPPQCGGNFFVLTDFDASAFPQIFSTSRDVIWTDEAQDVVGFLEVGGVIRVEGLAGSD